MSETKRVGWDEYFVGILDGLAKRGTCPRRQCAAVIVDEDHNLLSTGYNGPPRGISHCIDVPCEGVDDAPGDSSRCLAVHAEANSILHLGDRMMRAATMYCTNKPCFGCAKLICQTPIRRVVYVNDYADKKGEILLWNAGKSVVPYMN